MSRKHLATVTALVAIAALAFAAAATSSGSAARSQQATAAATGSTTQIGTVSVRFTINRFVRRGKRLYAVGTTLARFTPTAAKAQDLPAASVKKAFTARVIAIKRLSSAQRICPILELTLGPVDLNLLGLIVHLDQVHLTITADSEGGVLGRLFCNLAGRGGGQQGAHRLTKAAHRSAFFDEQTRARLTSSRDGGGHRCASYVTCRYTEAEQKLNGVVIPILRGEQHQPIFRLRALACEKFQDG